MQNSFKIANHDCYICAQNMRHIYDWNGFQVLKCSSCGLESVYTRPTNEELSNFYQNISSKKMVRWENCRDLINKAFSQYLRIYSVYTKKSTPRSFLDVGGGVGYYTKAAENAGILSCLIDYADDAIQFAQKNLGISRAIKGDIQCCDEYLDGSLFDFVLSRHTIEHMIEPKKFIANLACVTNPGGILVVETPNADSKEQVAHPRQIIENFRILKKCNPDISLFSILKSALCKSFSGINPPKHLWGFTEKSLVILLEQHNFEVLSVKKPIVGHHQFDPLYYEYTRLGSRKGLGIPYYLYERLISLLFVNSGSNLVIFSRLKKSEPEINRKN